MTNNENKDTFMLIDYLNDKYVVGKLMLLLITAIFISLTFCSISDYRTLDNIMMDSTEVKFKLGSPSYLQEGAALYNTKNKLTGNSVKVNYIVVDNIDTNDKYCFIDEQYETILTNYPQLKNDKVVYKGNEEYGIGYIPYGYNSNDYSNGHSNDDINKYANVFSIYSINSKCNKYPRIFVDDGRKHDSYVMAITFGSISLLFITASIYYVAGYKLKELSSQYNYNDDSHDASSNSYKNNILSFISNSLNIVLMTFILLFKSVAMSIKHIVEGIISIPIILLLIFKDIILNIFHHKISNFEMEIVTEEDKTLIETYLGIDNTM